MKVIELKSDPAIFDLHWRDLKNFDMRDVRDRNFEAGDILYQREFDRGTQTYSGRTILQLVLWVMPGPAYNGLKKGSCIISLHPSTIKREGDFP